MQPPQIIETTGRSSQTYDIPTKLLQDRIIYLSGGINEELANSIITQLLWLQADSPDEPIDLYITSNGGEAYQGFGIKDIMDSISCKVNTLGVGICASMGAYLLAAGTGTRKATKNCRIMIHSVSAGANGVIHDMEVDYTESKYLQEKMLENLVRFTNGKTSADEMIAKTQRDYYMSADEAVDMGFIDCTV